MAQSYDVLVIGAGPAGSTAAKLAADAGLSTLLIDRAVFPRHKTCASWINRLAFERFPYLQARLDELVETPFYGIAFFDRTLEKEGRFLEPRPSGYLSLRAKFDDGLRRIAVEAGVEFLGGCAVTGVLQDGETVRARLADGREFTARVLIGADGASSRVAGVFRFGSTSTTRVSKATAGFFPSESTFASASAGSSTIIVTSVLCIHVS